MYVMGIDTSLASTGLAKISGTGKIWTAEIATKGKNSATEYETYRRLTYIADEVVAQINLGCAAVIMEGPARSATMGHVHDRGGLWWFIFDRITRLDIPISVCPPDNRPYWATGFKQGPKADKVNVAASISRYWDIDMPRTNNEYDALTLATMLAQECQSLGYMRRWQMPKKRTALHRLALARVTWPTPVAALSWLAVDHG